MWNLLNCPACQPHSQSLGLHPPYSIASQAHDVHLWTQGLPSSRHSGELATVQSGILWHPKEAPVSALCAPPGGPQCGKGLFTKALPKLLARNGKLPQSRKEFKTTLGIKTVPIFVRHVSASALGSEKKPVDIILIHLPFSNMIIICTTGIIDTTTVFYFRNFLGDIDCKAVVYLARMARGFSICTTCLLSVVQAVTISPRTTLWTKPKPQTSWHVLPFLLFFWMVNVHISSNLLCYIKAGSDLNRSLPGTNIGHCYMLPSRHKIKWLFFSLMALRDVIFQSLMGWSSQSMALHLYEHHKHVFYLHSSRCAHNYPPEIKATWSVLILMTCFLFFYWVDFILSFYISFTVTHDSTLLNIKTFFRTWYTGFSHYVLISRDIHVPNVLHTH
ncbi:vomeronasal type-1 receptor 4-like [Arvicola amphibius]|uniref:vomeronasal type-1 receptor 4-like n=1 Tax=Arvicola amphibius TaxID=1047088 RepID=UPI001C095BBF|nr:vomeronasal type-1 receptor 4-like [Arvicola amphibius]